MKMKKQIPHLKPCEAGLSSQRLGKLPPESCIPHTLTYYEYYLLNELKL